MAAAAACTAKSAPDEGISLVSSGEAQTGSLHSAILPGGKEGQAIQQRGLPLMCP